MVAKVHEVKSMIKFQRKRLLCLPEAVGHVKVIDDELVYNVLIAVNFLVSTKKELAGRPSLYIMSTMGKPPGLD